MTDSVIRLMRATDAMPNEQDSAELFRRLSAVEQAQKVHEAECAIRNADIREWRRDVSGDIGNLKRTEARMIGFLAAASAVGSLVGGALAAAAQKYL